MRFVIKTGKALLAAQIEKLCSHLISTALMSAAGLSVISSVDLYLAPHFSKQAMSHQLKLPQSQHTNSRIGTSENGLKINIIIIKHTGFSSLHSLPHTHTLSVVLSLPFSLTHTHPLCPSISTLLPFTHTHTHTMYTVLLSF